MTIGSKSKGERKVSDEHLRGKQLKNPSKKFRDYMQDAVHHRHHDIPLDVRWRHGTNFMTNQEMKFLETISVDQYPEVLDVTRRLNLAQIDDHEENQFPESIQGLARGHLSTNGDGPTQDGEIISNFAMADYCPHLGSNLYIDRKQTLPCHYYRTESGCKGGAVCPLVHISDTDAIICSEAALARAEQIQNEEAHISDPTLQFGCSNVNCKPLHSSVHGVFRTNTALEHLFRPVDVDGFEPLAQTIGVCHMPDGSFPPRLYKMDSIPTEAVYSGNSFT